MLAAHDNKLKNLPHSIREIYAILSTDKTDEEKVKGILQITHERLKDSLAAFTRSTESKEIYDA